MEGAQTGAAWGSLLPMAMSILGKGARTLSKRRVEPDVGRGEDFIPPNLLDEGRVGQFVKGPLGDSMFANVRLREYSKRSMDIAEETLEKQERLLKATRKAAQLTKQGADRAVREGLTGQIAGEQDQFRRRAITSAIPPNLPPDRQQQIAAMSPVNARNAIDDYWTKEGFQTAKQQTYSFDEKAFTKELKNLFEGDSELRRAAGNYRTLVKQGFKQFFRRDEPTITPAKGFQITGKVEQPTVTPSRMGVMRGDDLYTLRNVFAKRANTATGTARAANRQIVRLFDRHIERQIPDNLLERHRNDMDFYGRKVQLGDAVTDATLKRAGNFTPDDWLGAISKTRRGKGEGHMQAEATELQQRHGDMKKQLPRLIQTNPVKAQQDDAIASVQQGIKDTRKQMKTIRDRTPALARFPTKMVASAGFGAPLAPISVGGFVPAGAMITNVLSTQPGLRALAGQTRPQQAVIRGLDKVEVGRNALLDALRIMPGVYAAQQPVDDDF